ncbi:MAG: hypothetical protein Q8Q35_01215 [Nanoarchaeota archaeon]|nr:hypothetical protein [Nanoarchaeota archaeon]
MQNKLKILLLGVFVLILTSQVYATERILEIKLDIVRDKSVDIKEVKANTGFKGEYNTGNYSITLYGKDKVTYRFSPAFYIRISNESVHRSLETSVTKETLYLPFIEGLYLIEVSYNEELLEHYNANDLLCNKNGVCQDNENFVGCPNDCKSYEKDGICMNIRDGQCDLDCSKNQDYECTGEIFQSNIINNSLKYPLYGMVGLISLYLIYKYLKKL